MAIDRSEYQINIKTSADVSSAKAANDAMLELTKTAGETGEGLEKAGHSAHELHEKFHLVKLAAGEALGPIAELVHAIGRVITGTLFVSSATKGARVVEDELKRMGFLEVAHIAGYDSLTNSIYGCFPKFSDFPFEEHFLTMLKKFGVVPTVTNPPPL
jgi:hypothetical protein